MTKDLPQIKNKKSLKICLQALKVPGAEVKK
jgi:hypothetical protein